MVWYGVAGRGQFFRLKFFYMNTRVQNPMGIEKLRNEKEFKHGEQDYKQTYYYAS